MPGVSHFSIDELLKELETLVKAGLNKVLLFGVGEEKTVDASSSHSHNSIVPQAVRAIKEKFGETVYVITDVCVCAYTTHGHCGIIESEYVHNDLSVDVFS